jgi:hypothetical protein
MVISRLTTKKRRPKQNIGNFSSCKMETSFRYNSLLQKDFMYWLEFDTDVLSYNTPGIAVNYHSSGKEKSYTPDFQVVRYQKKQIIEVKSQMYVRTLNVATRTSFSQVKIVSNNSTSSDLEVFTRKTTF